MIKQISFFLLFLIQTASPQGIIRLKTRDLVPAQAAAPVRSGRASEARHFLVLFASYPGPDVLAELASRRIHVLSYVPENALMVSAAVLNLQGLDVTWSGPMEAEDKISPVVVASAGAYLILFQPDTDIMANKALVENLGFTVIPNSSLLAGQLVVSGAFSGLPELAGLDQVAYILPASLPLLEGDIVMACGGAITQSGPVAQYVKADAGWGKSPNGSISLQYFFDSVTPKISETLVRSEIARAFAEWARYANIVFTPATQPGLTHSIDILFARFAHGDAYPFNGPGGQLAHTFYPAPYVGDPIAGDMHLNADEPWTVGGGSGGVDLYSVALHEAGHALGLGHSDNPSAVMYPYYSAQTHLTADDIAGIQAIYGAIAPTTPVVPVSSGSAATSSTSGTGTAAAGSGTSSTTSSTGTGTSNTSTSSTGTTTVADTVAPTLTIVTPGASIVSTSSTSISVSGTAADNVAVSKVTWTTSVGSSGTATGTKAWSATIPLFVGTNVVTVRAYDAAGNSTWRAVTVVRN